MKNSLVIIVDYGDTKNYGFINTIENFLIVNINKEKSANLIKTNIKTFYKMDDFEEVLLKFEDVVFLKILDNHIYEDLITNAYEEYRKRSVNYLRVRKHPVTRNIIEIINGTLLKEKYREVKNKIFTNFLQEIKNPLNIMDKDQSDYKYALDNADTIFTNPLKIYLQLLDNCSKKCPKCIYNPRDEYVTRRDGFEIDFSLLEKLFKELATFDNKPFVEPSFDCEPLMYSKFKEFLELATKYEIPIHIVTNAMLLSKEKIKLILGCKEVVNIVISLDAVTQETYRKVQPSGRLSKVEKNIMSLIEQRGENKFPSINMCYTDSSDNSHEFKSFLYKWIEKVDSISKNNMFGEDNNKKFSSKNFNEPIYGYCFPMYTDMFISSRGEMFNCHQDVLVNTPVSKNFNKTSIMEVYRSEKLQERRKQHIKGEYPSLCNNCLEFAVCQYSIAKEEEKYVQVFPFHKVFLKG